MNKKNVFAVIISIVLGAIFIAVAFWGYSSVKGCSGSAQEESETEITRPERAQESTLPRISLDEANAIAAEERGDNPLYDMFETFRTNNMIFLDKSSPCNQGAESLQDFALQFASNPTFQKSRTQLTHEDGYSPAFGSISLTMLEPDSVNFFAAWNHVEANLAAFCTGWLGSEMSEEYVFSRSSEGEKWYLVEYFSAAKESDHPF